jgi:hypothetical protein
MEALLNVAQKQVMAELQDRLQTKYPGNIAKMKDIQAEADTLCQECDQPGAITVREENGQAVFSISNPMSLMLIAAHLQQKAKVV